MSMRNGSFVARLLARHLKTATLSFFVGFGLAACADSDDAEEPVQGDNAVQDESGAPMSDDVASADAPDSYAEAKPADGVGGTEEGMQPAAPKEENIDDTAAVPKEAIDSSTDTVDAELTADGGGAPAAAVESTPPAEPVADSLAQTLDPEPAAPAETPSYGDGKSVSSPGAAKFLKSKVDNGSYASTGKAKGKKSSSNKAAATGGDASYIVRHGDTLADIAAKIYGSAGQWQAMAQLNGIGAPFRIYPGDEVRYDTSTPKAKAFAKNSKSATKTVKVQKGDTLSKIASEVLGSPFAWKTLLAYNKDKISNPNRITSGMVLAYEDTGAAKSSDGSKVLKAKTVKAGKAIKAKSSAKSKTKPPITEDSLGE